MYSEELDQHMEKCKEWETKSANNWAYEQNRETWWEKENVHASAKHKK